MGRRSRRPTEAALLPDRPSLHSVTSTRCPVAARIIEGAAGIHEDRPLDDSFSYPVLPRSIDTPLAPAYIFSWSLMSSTPFGEHLKREREMRGVSLEEIAAATRINTRFLEAIENERWDQLPGGVFNRGFIRSIARYLGMDEDNLVAEYDLDVKGNGNSHHAVVLPSRQANGPAERVSSRNWQPAAVAFAALVILIVVGAAAVHYRMKISSGMHLGASAIAARVHRLRSKPSAGATIAPPASAPNSATSASLAANAAPLTLQLEAGKPAKVKVLADGNVVFDGRVQANDVKQFRARDRFEVSSSESSALLLELDGQTVPPIGTPGQPGSVTLTRSDLSSATGDAH
jgi:cytoskeletal protein RodZ